MSRPSTRGARRTGVATTFLVVATVASTVTASAASLGGVNSGGVLIESAPVSIDIPEPPGPLVQTDFTGCSNFIDPTWTDESGAVWTRQSGSWQCLGDGTLRSQSRVLFANLTVDVSQVTDLRVSTTIADISNQNNRSGPGLSLLEDGSGDFLYVVYRRDLEELHIGVTGAQPTAYDVGDTETATITATVADGEVRVAFEGGIFSADIPGGFTTARVGLVADNDNQSRFDSFLVEDLS